MKGTLILAALTTLASGAAVEADKVKRVPVPVYSPAPGCTPPNLGYIQDGGFGGDGSAFGFDPPTGTLKIKSSIKDNFGYRVDGTNNRAFTFQVTKGTGTFNIYQYVCLNTSKPVQPYYRVGLTAPASGKPSSGSGCTVQFLFNGGTVGTGPDPICGATANAPDDYGSCTEGSYNKKTGYQSIRGAFALQGRTDVNRVELVFNCTNQTSSGFNAQAVLDYFTLSPLYPGRPF